MSSSDSSPSSSDSEDDLPSPRRASPRKAGQLAQNQKGKNVPIPQKSPQKKGKAGKVVPSRKSPRTNEKIPTPPTSPVPGPSPAKIPKKEPKTPVKQRKPTKKVEEEASKVISQAPSTSTKANDKDSAVTEDSDFILTPVLKPSNSKASTSNEDNGNVPSKASIPAKGTDTKKPTAAKGKKGLLGKGSNAKVADKITDDKDSTVTEDFDFTLTPVLKASSSKASTSNEDHGNVPNSKGSGSKASTPAKGTDTKKPTTAKGKKGLLGKGGNAKFADKITDEEKYTGMSIILGMSNDDLEEFLNRVDAQCPIDDIKPDKVRVSSIEWDQVSFSCYGPEQCKSAWKYLQNNARKFRIMHEVVEEVKISFRTDFNRFMKKVIESAPDFPKQPYASGGFQFYCKELWDSYKECQERINAKVENFLNFQTKCYEDWKNMSDERKQEYDGKAKALQAEYRQKVKEYYAKYPGFAPRQDKLSKDGKPERIVSDYYRRQALKISNELYKDAPKLPLNPMQLYLHHRLNRLNPPPTSDEIPSLKAHYIHKWKKLKVDKKLKWIEKCIERSEQYLEDVREYKKTHPLFVLSKEFQISKLVSKEEFNIWGAAHGQPPKPKLTTFDLFLDDFTRTEGVTGTDEEIRKLATVKWEELDGNSKEIYKCNHKMSQLQFKKEFEEYFNRLPELLRNLAVDTLPKKYKRTFLEEVNKEPLVLDGDPELVRGTMHASSVSTDDDESTKRKRNQETEDEIGDSLESQEELEGGGGDSSKKKKKKKKRKLEEEGQKAEQEKTNDIPLYVTDLTDEHIKLLEQKKEESEVSKIANLKKSDREQLEVTAKRAESLSGRKVFAYPPGKGFSQRTINEAIRGIFDGRQRLRKFSAYYYYAKYVAREPTWVSLTDKIGVVHTAIRIIETFHRLSQHQKQVFLDEAYAFYRTHRFYDREITSDYDVLNPTLRTFPEEPKPPPKNAVILYQMDLRLKRLRDPDHKSVPWSKLDRDTQLFYLKKFYQMKKEYVYEFERFVKNMTPNDMVEYLVRRCHDWDVHWKSANRNDEDALEVAARTPCSRLSYSAEMSDDGQESEPELYETGLNLNSQNNLYQQTFRYINNPFSVVDTTKKKNVLVKKLTLRKRLNQRKKKKKRNVKKKINRFPYGARKRPPKEKDSDLPTSSDDDEFFDQNNAKNLRKFRRKLREAQRYYYPLEDVHEAPFLCKLTENFQNLSYNACWWMSNEGKLCAINALRHREQALRRFKGKPNQDKGRANRDTILKSKRKAISLQRFANKGKDLTVKTVRKRKPAQSDLAKSRQKEMAQEDALTSDEEDKGKPTNKSSVRKRVQTDPSKSKPTKRKAKKANVQEDVGTYSDEENEIRRKTKTSVQKRVQSVPAKPIQKKKVENVTSEESDDSDSCDSVSDDSDSYDSDSDDSDSDVVRSDTVVTIPDEGNKRKQTKCPVRKRGQSAPSKTKRIGRNANVQNDAVTITNEDSNSRDHSTNPLWTPLQVTGSEQENADNDAQPSFMLVSSPLHLEEKDEDKEYPQTMSSEELPLPGTSGNFGFIHDGNLSFENLDVELGDYGIVRSPKDISLLGIPEDVDEGQFFAPQFTEEELSQLQHE